MPFGLQGRTWTEVFRKQNFKLSSLFALNNYERRNASELWKCERPPPTPTPGQLKLHSTCDALPFVSPLSASGTLAQFPNQQLDITLVFLFHPCQHLWITTLYLSTTVADISLFLHCFLRLKLLWVQLLSQRVGTPLWRSFTALGFHLCLSHFGRGGKEGISLYQWRALS